MGLLACTWLPPNGTATAAAEAAAATAGSCNSVGVGGGGWALEDTMVRVKGRKEQLHVGTFHNSWDPASYFTCWGWPEECCLQYLWRIMCSGQKRSIANCADGNWRLFNLLYFSCAIICSYHSQMPHRVLLTEFVSSLIPAALKECCFLPLDDWSWQWEWASHWDDRGFFFFAFLFFILSLSELSTSFTSLCQV